MVKDDWPPPYWSIIQICDFLLALGFTQGITEVFHTKDQKAEYRIQKFPENADKTTCYD